MSTSDTVNTVTSSPHSLNWTRLQQGLLTLTLLVMTAHVLIYVAFGAALIPFPYDYDQAEGFELNNALLLAQGEHPYGDNDVYPFYASGYAPLFHLLMVPFVWAFGPDFWYGRLLIFLSTFVTAGAIAWAVKREARHGAVALLAGMAFLASNYIYHIGPLLRQHLLMVMFETLAVVIVAHAFDHATPGRRWRLFVAFALLLLAGYTKQLAYTTCIAVFAFVMLRRPRAALVYGGGLVAAAALIFGGWMLLTEGHWWTNIITSNQNPYITEQFTGLLRQFLRLHWPLVLLAGLMVLYELYFTRLSAYSIWFVISFISTVGAGKWGAGDSYFATTLAAACILTGIAIARTLNQGWRFPASHYLTRWLKPARFAGMGPLLGVGALSLGLIYGLTVIKLPTSGPIFGPLADALNVEPAPGHRYPLYDAAGWTVGYAVTGHFPAPEDYANGRLIEERMRAVEGPVMSEDAGFALQAGREVVTNAVQLNNLWQMGLHDPANLLAMIENHDFGLIVLRARFLPPPVMRAIETHYQPTQTVPMNGFAYELWEPRS